LEVKLASESVIIFQDLIFKLDEQGIEAREMLAVGGIV
jgi:hypothetical protein